MRFMRAGTPIAALVGLCGSAHAQPTDAFWANPDGGVWSEPENWSPVVVPNNDGKSFFNATLDLQDGPYQVFLDIDATLENFSLLWGGATLDLGARNLNVVGDLRLRAGMFTRGEGKAALVTVGGTLSLEDGAALMGAGTIQSDGNLLFESDDTIDICNTGVDHRGADGIGWTGSGAINIDQGGTLSNGDKSTFAIDGTTDRDIVGDDTGQLSNDGKLVQGDGSRGVAGVTTLTGVNFVNNGSVIVQGGALNLNPTNNLAPNNTLAQGSWLVRNDAVLRFGQGTSVIQTLAADVTLVGNAARFLTAEGRDALESVNRVSQSGEFKLREGRTISLLEDLVVENLLSVEGVPPQGVPDPGRVVLPDGTAAVDGTVIFTETSTLELIFNGNEPDFYGQVIAEDAIAEPGSTLRLVVNPGVQLNVGDTFELVQARQLTGEFTNLVGLNLGNGLAFQVIQDDGGVTAFIGPSECPVDLVPDGVLNFFDVAAFIAFFLEGNPVADFNQDGVFDFFDVAAFVVEFGRGCPDI